ncbi:MAG: flagellar hook-length control protein FliK [Candidatus Midichloria sp.]|nr:flagellar hook-length control protein FliK [Candidatus Midichloria sp.]
MTQNIPKIFLPINKDNSQAQTTLTIKQLFIGTNLNFLDLLLNLGGRNFVIGNLKEYIEPNNEFVAEVAPADNENQFFDVNFSTFGLVNIKAEVEQELPNESSKVFTIKEQLWPKPQLSYEDKKQVVKQVAELPIQDVNDESIIQNVLKQPTNSTILPFKMQFNDGAIEKVDEETKQQSSQTKTVKEELIYQFLNPIEIRIDPAEICYKYETVEQNNLENINNQILTHISATRNGRSDKIVVQLEPAHLGSVEIVFVSDQENHEKHSIQINVGRESTYFMLKQNSERLVSMLAGIGINQANINFAMQSFERKTRTSRNSSDTLSQTTTNECLGNGLDKKIKTASILVNGIVSGVNLLI